MSAQIIPMPRYGANESDWDHFSLILGLTADLLPCVANPNAEISAESKMRGLGKTPSRYNSQGKVAGIAAWTQHQATNADVARWRAQRDYSVCLQTRTVRALDVDVPDAAEAAAIAKVIGEVLPRRIRVGAAKFLAAFTLPGGFTKRVIHTRHGMIEFLANGQQFVAVGAHFDRNGPTGTRYEWRGGLPAEFPLITTDAFENLWAALVRQFAIEPVAEQQPGPSRVLKLADAAHADPLGQHLIDHGWALSTERDGRLHVRCPWADQHTAESAESATSYFPAHTGGFARGHFHCMHAHCAERTDDEFQVAVGYAEDDFAVVDLQPDAPSGRFTVTQVGAFADRPPVQWLVKGVLPRNGLVVVYGESGAGKSFWVLDLAMSVARGEAWRGLKTAQGSVVYVAAEGAHGFKSRCIAYANQHDAELVDIPLGVVADAPNLMALSDTNALCVAIEAYAAPAVIVIDTLARSMVGEENSAADMGRVISHCDNLAKRTGAVIVLVHHAGKSSERGARGSSALRAAADMEIEIVRVDRRHAAVISKSKDGEDGAEFGFELRAGVEVGVDADGEPVSSCVVVQDATATVRGSIRKQRALGTVERAVVSTAAGLFDFDQEVNTESLRAAVVEMLAKPVGRDTRKQRFDRALSALLEAKMLVEGRFGVVIRGETWPV